MNIPKLCLVKGWREQKARGSDANKGVTLKSKNFKYIHTACFSKYVVQFGIDDVLSLLLTYCLKSRYYTNGETARRHDTHLQCQHLGGKSRQVPEFEVSQGYRVRCCLKKRKKENKLKC